MVDLECRKKLDRALVLCAMQDVMRCAYRFRTDVNCDSFGHVGLTPSFFYRFPKPKTLEKLKPLLTRH